MSGCITLLGEERWATVRTQPSVQKIFKITLYQFIKNTARNQAVVLGQLPLPFSPQIHLDKSSMTEKEKLRSGGRGGTQAIGMHAMYFIM